MKKKNRSEWPKWFECVHIPACKRTSMVRFDSERQRVGLFICESFAAYDCCLKSRQKMENEKWPQITRAEAVRRVGKLALKGIKRRKSK